MTSIRSQVAGPDLEVAQRIWRTVRRLGAGRLTPGAAILPFRDDLQEQLDWLAQEVEEHDGDARVLPVVDLGEGGGEGVRADAGRSAGRVQAAPIGAPRLPRAGAPASRTGRRLLARLRTEKELLALQRRFREIRARDYLRAHGRWEPGWPIFTLIR